MAGYDWYNGMSNNAVAAYDNGEKPMSKWKKSDILDYVASKGWDTDFFKKLKADKLKSVFLYESSWHHTSKYFNRTYFYAIDTDLTEEEIKEDLIKEEKRKQEAEEKRKQTAEKFHSFKTGDIIGGFGEILRVSEVLDNQLICEYLFSSTYSAEHFKNHNTYIYEYHIEDYHKSDNIRELFILDFKKPIYTFEDKKRILRKFREYEKQGILNVSLEK